VKILKDGKNKSSSSKTTVKKHYQFSNKLKKLSKSNKNKSKMLKMMKKNQANFQIVLLILNLEI